MSRKTIITCDICNTVTDKAGPVRWGIGTNGAQNSLHQDYEDVCPLCRIRIREAIEGAVKERKDAIPF